MDARTIVRNELAFAFLNKTPIVPGHILISPTRHAQYYEELTLEEKSAVEKIREQMKNALRQTLGAEGFNYSWNENPAAGQTVLHFHLHVIPRKEGDTGVHGYEPRKFLYRPSGDRPESPAEELAEITTQIRNVL